MSPLCRHTFLFAIALLALCGSACSSVDSAHETITVTPADLERGTELARRLAEAPIGLFSADRFTGTNGVTLHYRLLAPPEIRPGTRYPLVLSLHGSGEIGEDNTAQLTPFQRSWLQPEIRKQLPAYVLVPQFPARSASYAADPGDGLRSSHADPPLLAAMELVDALVERLPIDQRRVYVVGFSMGASAAWNALLLRPDRFAAAVPIGGVPPERRLAPRLAAANLLVIHGQADAENTPEEARAMFVALQRAGARRVRLREYEGLGHRVPPEMLAGTEWRKWLFAQRR
jgi:predicted peptidase